MYLQLQLNSHVCASLSLADGRDMENNKNSSNVEIEKKFSVCLTRCTIAIVQISFLLHPVMLHPKTYQITASPVCGFQSPAQTAAFHYGRAY